MIELLQAVVLGVVQGLAEFIPVSSSGHLVLLPALTGMDPGGLPFDVALHLGTMAAVVVYLRDELAAIVRAVLGRDSSRSALRYRTLAGYAVVATVPVGIAGLTLEDTFERIFATPVVAATALLVTGALLLVGERVRDRRVADAAAPVLAEQRVADATADHLPVDPALGVLDDARPIPPAAVGEPPATLPTGRDPSDPLADDLDSLTLRQALIVGVAQCFALFPGISRSGTTIVAGLGAGLSREASTRFSFLLSLPALVGATVVSVPDLADGGGVYELPAVVAGVLAAFAAGYFAIRWLIRVVSSERLTGFALYCLAAGTASLVVLSVL